MPKARWLYAAYIIAIIALPLLTTRLWERLHLSAQSLVYIALSWIVLLAALTAVLTYKQHQKNSAERT